MKSLLIGIACCMMATQVQAQYRAPLLDSGPIAAAQQQITRPAFVVESLGATLGSLAGFGLVYYLSDPCDTEDDVVCPLEKAGTAIAAATLGAAVGGYGAGKWQDTSPSLLGASLGAVGGAAAGIGVWHLLREELNVINSDLGAIASYSITQGLVTALGSRLFSRD